MNKNLFISALVVGAVGFFAFSLGYDKGWKAGGMSKEIVFGMMANSIDNHVFMAGQQYHCTLTHHTE